HTQGEKFPCAWKFFGIRREIFRKNRNGKTDGADRKIVFTMQARTAARRETDACIRADGATLTGRMSA
ncbi:MAG: hypothetical protein LBD27_04100, partial [Tannerella sp.]|nr:hypothetical protein [Tannerella sp.]